MVKNILAIDIALADQPIYISIDDENASMNAIIEGAIKAMQESGKTHEATQLGQIYADHQMFQGGNRIEKGVSFKEMKIESREVQGEKINFAEVSLIREHVGGK